MRSLRQIFIIRAQEEEANISFSFSFLCNGSKNKIKKKQVTLTARKVLREAKKKERDKLYFATKAHHYYIYQIKCPSKDGYQEKIIH